MLTSSYKGPENRDDKRRGQSWPLRQLHKSSDDGGDQYKEAQSWHPQVAHCAVHEHAGSFEGGLKLDP